MALVHWNAAMAVGIPSIDADHMKLVGLTNQIYEAMSRGDGNAVMDKVVVELIKYTRSHFTREEALLKTHGYAKLAEHSAAHAKLLGTVDDLHRRLAAGERVSSVSTGNFLKSWLTDHIKGSDRDYAELLKDKGIH